MVPLIIEPPPGGAGGSSSSSSSRKKKTSIYVAAGALVGAVCLLLVGAGGYWCRRRNKSDSISRRRKRTESLLRQQQHYPRRYRLRGGDEVLRPQAGARRQRHGVQGQAPGPGRARGRGEDAQGGQGGEQRGGVRERGGQHQPDVARERGDAAGVLPGGVQEEEEGGPRLRVHAQRLPGKIHRRRRRRRPRWRTAVAELGAAVGHRGGHRAWAGVPPPRCNAHIVHFDIKPHNILLDRDRPKISDFGLAKLCPQKESTISVAIAGARGTVGYIAPEVFSRQKGAAVTSKSDVYSYGMMVLEMVGARRSSLVNGGGGAGVSASADDDDSGCCGTAGASSRYFPQWLYEDLDRFCATSVCGGDEAGAEEVVRKMVVVGLWCIRMSPQGRPTISRVVEMLEKTTPDELRLPPTS